MNEFSKKIYRLFRVKGYARCDLRLKENGDIYFLEINPNPSIASWEDFAKSGEKGGMKYEELVEKILTLAQV